MAISKRDEQRVSTLIGVSSVDGITPTLVEIEPTSGGLIISGSITANLSATDNAVLDAIALGYGTEGDALADGILMQGDDGTDRTNVLVDTAGHLQIDIVAGGVQITDGVDNAVVDGQGGLRISVGDPSVTANLASVFTPASDAQAALHGLTTVSQNMMYNGSTWSRVPGTAAAGLLVNLGTNNDIVAAGDVASDAADSGNPVKVGGKAVNQDGTAPGTAVTEADRANFITDVYGRQFVETAHPNLWTVSADYAGAQTNTSIKATPGESLSLYITDIMISNGATAGNITLLDGSAGTVIWEIYSAISGGCVSNLKTPIKLTVNTALCITSTTVTTHSVTINGFIAP